MSQQIRAGDMIVNTSYYATPVPRGDDVFLDPHQDSCFGSGFLTLNYVKVHFVAIEVSIVWCTVC